MLLLRDLLSMSTPLRLATIATIASFLLAQPSLSQTYSSCDPIKQSGCPADPALGGSTSATFSSGASNQFSAQGSVSYNSDGAGFTVSGDGDAPTLVSNWYIMFGKYEITMKAAPGTGIVSSSVLQSDDLDEIDWEWVGAYDDQVQTNYFGKGITGSYNRGATISISGTQDGWHTYSVDWTEDQIVWAVDGTTVRTLTASAAGDQYPQTPCRLKIGAWCGGCPGNAQGTINWAGGPANFGDGPFTMTVQSVSVVDYSTGSEYKYGDQSGTWDSIESVGGRVNGNIGGSISDPSDPPAASGSASPTVYPVDPSTSGNVTATTYPGLPSGWSVNPATGKVVPPSSAGMVVVPMRFLYATMCAIVGGFLLGFRL